MKIPVYDQQYVPNQSPGEPRMVASQTGSGIAQIGEGIQNLALALNHREKAKAQVWFSKASSDLDLSLNQVMADQKKSALPGAKDFSKNYLSSFDKIKEEAISNAPDASSKELMAAHLDQTRKAYGIHAMQYEESEGMRYMGQQFDEGVDSSAKLVNQTPELFDREMGKWGMTANQIGLPPAEQSALKEVARKNLAWNAVTGQIDRDPNADKHEGTAWNLLTSEEQTKALHYATQKKNEFKAERMASLFIDVSKGVIDKAPMLPGDLIDLPKAKAQANALMKTNNVKLDGEQQLQMESYIERVAADRERDVKRKREVTTATMFAKLDQNGGDYQALVAENPWLANQPTEITDRINKYAGEVATGGTKTTDWQAYTSLTNDPALLKQTNIDALSDKLNSKEKNQLIKMQAELNKPGAEQNIIATNTMVSKMLKDAGYNSDDDIGKYNSLLQEAINQEIILTKKDRLPQTRIKEIAADLLVEQVTAKRHFWFDKEEVGFKVEVPEELLPKIKETLSAEGLPANDYNVNQAYRSILRSKNGQ